jgi:hypothetical protein
VTDAQGSYVFPAGAPLQTTCYRVDGGKVRSIVMRARVAYQIALSTPPVSGLAGAPLTISGTVVPMPAGGVVYVERGSASGLGFHRVGAATVGADGSFSLAHAFFGAGSATLRVAVPGDEERDGTVSDPFTVQLTRGGAEAPPA